MGWRYTPLFLGYEIAYTIIVTNYQLPFIARNRFPAVSLPTSGLSHEAAPK
jgi:hypothetical protein